MMVQICEAGRDPCGCDQWKKGIRTINNQYPDDNRDFDINAGDGIEITPATAGITIAVKAPLPGPMVYQGTVGTGGTVASLPAANVTNIGWTYVAVTAGTTPDDTPKSYAIGDMLVSNGEEWTVIPAGDDPVDWSQIQNKPTTLSGYGITDAVNTTGDQTGIAGAKTWTGLNTFNNTAIKQKSTLTARDQTVSNRTFVASIETLDKNGNSISEIETTRYPTGNWLKMFIRNASGTSKALTLTAQDDGTTWGEIGNRTYNSANTNDIVTIGSLASNPSVVHPTYTHQNITFNTIDGLTITPADNNNNSKGFELCGNILVINLALNITGTYTGTTGWQTLFDWPAGTNGIRAPYLMNVIDFSSNSCIRLHQGRYLYFTNGTTYNYQFNCQVICPYNG